MGRPDAKTWAQNLQPLVTLFSERLTTYFKQLEKPVRTGVHPNSALGMNLMWDYLTIAKDDTLKAAVTETAKRFYTNDKKCETATEPGPADFISPCMSEAAIMGRILPPAEFVAWFDTFMPALYSPEFKPLTQPMDPALITNPGEARRQVAHDRPRLHAGGGNEPGRRGPSVVGHARRRAPPPLRDARQPGHDRDARRGLPRIALSWGVLDAVLADGLTGRSGSAFGARARGAGFDQSRVASGIRPSISQCSRGPTPARYGRRATSLGCGRRRC